MIAVCKLPIAPASAWPATGVPRFIACHRNCLSLLCRCPAGSTSATQFECGNPSVYCPSGSGLPHQASSGHFTTDAPTSSTASSQSLCPPGSYCASGQRIPCPAGTFSSVFGANSSMACTSCSAGSYSAVVGAASATVCSMCPIGSFAIRNGATSASVCTLCLPGTFSSAQPAFECSLCKPATFQDQPGRTSCLPCIDNQVSAGSGASFCSPCPTGTVEQNHTACVRGQCQAGFIPGNDGVYGQKCLPCHPGEFAPSNSVHCSDCAQQTYAIQNGSAECKACPSSGVVCSSGIVTGLPGFWLYDIGNGTVRVAPCPYGKRLS